MRYQWFLLGFLVLLSIPDVIPAQAQIITVNSTTPCFYNYTAGADMWRQCGVTNDWLTTILLPFNWATGGYFSMICVAVLCMMTYIKYQKMAYPMLIGVLYLPLAWTLFPSTFLITAFVLVGLGIAIMIKYTYVNQTKDF